MKTRNADKAVLIGLILIIVLSTVNVSLFLFREGMKMQADPVYAYSVKTRIDRKSAYYNMQWASRLIVGKP